MEENSYQGVVQDTLSWRMLNQVMLPRILTVRHPSINHLSSINPSLSIFICSETTSFWKFIRFSIWLPCLI